jgi:hypothetical protein
LTGAGTALTALLSGTGAVYRNMAKDHAVMPYIVFSLVAGAPLNITPSDMRDQVYFVRAYASGALTASKIDEQISAQLHHGTLSVSGYTTYRIDRESDFEVVETPESGDKVFMSGAYYRVSIDA